MKLTESLFRLRTRADLAETVLHVSYDVDAAFCIPRSLFVFLYKKPPESSNDRLWVLILIFSTKLWLNLFEKFEQPLIGFPKVNSDAQYLIEVVNHDPTRSVSFFVHRCVFVI